MLERADEQVTGWARGVAGDAEVALGPPVARPDGPVVSLHLLALADIPPARGSGPGPAPRQVDARYLVTTAAPEPEAAHRLLGALLFAAMDEPGFEVGFDAAPVAVWAGEPPGPSFSLGVRVRQEPEPRRAPSVLGPVVVRGTPTTALHGLVVGPGDVPIPDAFILLPRLSVSTRSDRRGQFRFAAVPAGSPTDVLVRAKASEFPFTIAGPPGAEPVVLRLQLSES